MEVFLGMYGHFSSLSVDFSSDFPKERPFLKIILNGFLKFSSTRMPPGWALIILEAPLNGFSGGTLVDRLKCFPVVFRQVFAIFFLLTNFF